MSGTILAAVARDATARVNALALPSRRTQPFKAMTTPPTVAALNTGASAITSSQTVSSLVNPGTVGSAVTTGRFTYLGCGGIVQSGVSYPQVEYVKSTHVTSTQMSTSAINIDFVFDGTQIELLFLGGGGCVLVSVDGEYVSATPTTIPSDGSPYRLLHTFASRALRNLRVEFTNIHFGGVTVGPNDNVWAAPRTGPRCVFIGDSFVEATGATPGLSMVVHFRQRMGWPDTFISGVGGSGYINPTNIVDARVPFLGRITNDVTAHAPDIVIVAGGLNDRLFTTTEITNATATYFAALRAALPLASLICVGPMNPAWDSTLTGVAETAVFAGAAPYVRGIVPQANINPLWITGTGKVGATTGTGNRDLCISSDGTHPSPAGHEMYGARIAEAVRAILR